jgi:hypothetical protein
MHGATIRFIILHKLNSVGQFSCNSQNVFLLFCFVLDRKPSLSSQSVPCTVTSLSTVFLDGNFYYGFRNIILCISAVWLFFSCGYQLNFLVGKWGGNLVLLADCCLSTRPRSCGGFSSRPFTS